MKVCKRQVIEIPLKGKQQLVNKKLSKRLDPRKPAKAEFLPRVPQIMQQTQKKQNHKVGNYKKKTLIAIDLSAALETMTQLEANGANAEDEAGDVICMMEMGKVHKTQQQRIVSIVVVVVALERVQVLLLTAHTLIHKFFLPVLTTALKRDGKSID